MVISATTSNSSLHHQLQTFTSQNNNNNLRDASFSSYLNNKEENLPKSNQPFISNRKEPLQLGVKKEEDGEIGVFDAERYFNGLEVETPRVSTNDANKLKYMKDQQQKALQNRNYKVPYGTPSVCSESSLNSQNALIQSALKNSSNNNSRKNQVPRKSLLATLGCKYCSCYDKNSVNVNDHAGEISFNKTTTNGKTTTEKPFKHDQDYNHSIKNKKTTKPHPAAELLMNKDIYLQKQEKFSSFNSSTGNQMVKKMQLQEVENPRKTLEVFGSPILDERSKTLSFDKRLTLLPSWEDPPKHEEEIEFSSNSGEKNYDDIDDAESDASSDLFEIESLTGNKTNPFFTRTTSNIASGCASPTCYAPSEVSIDWSVVTASAVEYDDQGSVITIRSPIRTSLNSSNGKTKNNKDIQRRRPSKLLGCNSQKAVGVAADAFTTTYEKEKQQSTNPKILSQVKKVESFGARNELHGYAKPSARRSLSPNAAQLLYI